MTDPIQTRSSENQLVINASLQEVWDAITRGELLRRWFGNDAKDATAGGRFFVSWHEHGAIDSPVTVFEPLKHLQFGDMMPGSPVPFATDIYLEAQGGATLVRIVASGFGMDTKWDSEFDAISKGWGYFIRNLRFYLEGFKGKSCHTIGFPLRTNMTRADAFAAYAKALGLDPARLTIGEPSTGKVEGLGKLEVRPDVFIPPGHLGLILGEKQDALLRIESFDSGKGGTWAYVMGLDWDEANPRLDAIGKALKKLAP